MGKQHEIGECFIEGADSYSYLGNGIWLACEEGPQDTAYNFYIEISDEQQDTIIGVTNNTNTPYFLDDGTRVRPFVHQRYLEDGTLVACLDSNYTLYGHR